MTSTDLDTLYLALPYGRSNATSIPTLCRMLGWSDRTVRDGIEALVSERHVAVVTLPTNPGVFIALTPEEVDMADAHLKSKAMSLLHRRRALRMCRERLAWSPTLFDV